MRSPIHNQEFGCLYPCFVSLPSSATVSVRKDHVDPSPSPVHGMVLYQSRAVQLHSFHKIHLFTIRFGAWIFPDQLLSVGQISGAVILPEARLAAAHLAKKWSHLLVPATDAAFYFHQVRNQWTFNDR